MWYYRLTVTPCSQNTGRIPHRDARKTKSRDDTHPLKYLTRKKFNVTYGDAFAQSPAKQAPPKGLGSISIPPNESIKPDKTANRSVTQGKIIPPIKDLSKGINPFRPIDKFMRKADLAKCPPKHFKIPTAHPWGLVGDVAAEPFSAQNHIYMSRQRKGV